MFLHTIVPPAQMFDGEPASEYTWRDLHNAYVEGVTQDGHFTVRRICSTNPRDYLDPRYAPGQIL